MSPVWMNIIISLLQITSKHLSPRHYNVTSPFILVFLKVIVTPIYKRIMAEKEEVREKEVKGEEERGDSVGLFLSMLL